MPLISQESRDAELGQRHAELLTTSRRVIAFLSIREAQGLTRLADVIPARPPPNGPGWKGSPGTTAETAVLDSIRFPNVIVWFGLGGHELRLAAGGMRTVRSRRSRRWLVPSVLGLLEAQEKKVREEVARLQEEAARVQAALGEAERALQRLVDARATVAEVLAEAPSVVEEPHRGSGAGSVVPHRTDGLTVSVQARGAPRPLQARQRGRCHR
ncbi:hypothetical protein PUR57_05260 [Streptomyces sp. JV176]|uniref:hypothetical protein n=1 Tax=Streptomyces sp. JV176 TaxID=858630 RepID=UPI002E79B5CD|nr:hypothetical protein [Streptomyces sp. JV176]MEE1798090.1 hypothetical protein [Streptomyces sp. JV176]